MIYQEYYKIKNKLQSKCEFEEEILLTFIEINKSLRERIKLMKIKIITFKDKQKT